MISSKDDELLDTYKRLRNVNKALNGQFIRQLAKKSVLECAKKLGLAKGKVMIFDSEDEFPALMDFCLYNSRMGGKTVIERYAQQTPPPPESDEMKVLQAMLDSYFSVFMVERVYTGRGVSLSSFGQEQVFLMDLGLGDTAVSGMSMAGRVLPFPDFHMSAGALLPLYEETVIKAVSPILEKWLLHHPDMGRTKLSPGLSSAFSAQVVRAALRAGALKSVKYSDVET
ncbi:MAG: hypothetical protein ABSG91_16490 [Syntrophobacteraceae bacterium]|jgi:hypothetical protein